MPSLDVSRLSELERFEIECRLLLSGAGFVRAHLSKFDEYQLFDAHRAFLSGDYMLTFTDRFGKLLALRPDVTLSVMKQAAYQPGSVIRSYYMEDVFRLSPDTHQYEARTQIGAELIAKEYSPSAFEIMDLAQKMLILSGRSTVLVLSHMGLWIHDDWYQSLANEKRGALMKLVAKKDKSGVKALLQKLNCPAQKQAKYLFLMNLSGTPEEVLGAVMESEFAEECSRIAREIAELSRKLSQGEEHMILLDLSLVNPLGYYNGIVFQGFVEGCGSLVISGGQYDSLAREFLKDHDKTCGAVGFALDLDELREVLR